MADRAGRRSAGSDDSRRSAGRDTLPDAGRHTGEPRERDDAPELQAQTNRSDYADAFMPDPEEGPALIGDDLAETLAEDFVRSATTGTNADDEVLDEVVPEEIGGPFIETTENEEFGDGSDPMNPIDGDAEPLPRAMSGLVDRPKEGE